MTLLFESVDFKKLDVRMTERNVARGVLTRAELDAAVKMLPDDGENAEWVSIDSLSKDTDESNLNGKSPHHPH
jgi:hypothetical protein